MANVDELIAGLEDKTPKIGKMVRKLKFKKGKPAKKPKIEPHGMGSNTKKLLRKVDA